MMTTRSLSCDLKFYIERYINKEMPNANLEMKQKEMCDK